MCHNYKDDNLIDILRLMIEHGADVNVKTEFHESPLYILCESQRESEKLIDLIRFLIEEGTDVKDMENENNPLLAICKNYKKDEFLMNIVQLLVENGADINHFWLWKDTLKHFARKKFCFVTLSCDLEKIIYMYAK